MDRRDFLKRVALIGGLAAIQPWDLLSHLGPLTGPAAEAAIRKQGFHGFRDGGLPDLDALYGLTSLPFINRTSYGGAYWTDPLGLPSQGWYDAVAAGYTNARKYLQLDHESYPGCQNGATQAERLDAAHKFSVIYQGLKAVLPTYNIGFYQYPCIRDLFRATAAHGSANYLAWQADCEDWAELWANCDTVYPSIYWFYNRAINGVDAMLGHELYFTENIAEAKRNRTLYGHGQPIIPYCSPYVTATSNFLDALVWEDMTRAAYLEGDGVLLWTGFSVSHTWDPYVPWWINFLARWPYGDRGVAKARTTKEQYIFQPVASSTFSGGDANPVSEGSVWAVDQAGSGSMRIQTGVVNATDRFADSGARYIGTGFNANQYSRGNLTVSSTTGSAVGYGLEICASSSARTMYRFTIDHAASNNASVYRYVAGVGTLLTGGAWTQSFSDGDQFTFANVGETLYVFKGSTLVKTIDDTGGGVNPSASRFPGIAHSSTTTSGSVDNWSGGNFRLAY